MGEVTLKVPADRVEAFRRCVYGRLALKGEALDHRAGALAFPNGRSWDKQIGDDPENIERCAVDVLEGAREIAALVELMEQLAWTDSIEGDLEITADDELLGSLVRDALVDVGDVIDGITDSMPFDRQAFESAATRGLWLADRNDKFAKAGAAA